MHDLQIEGTRHPHSVWRSRKRQSHRYGEGQWWATLKRWGEPLPWRGHTGLQQEHHEGHSGHGDGRPQQATAADPKTLVVRLLDDDRGLGPESNAECEANYCAE